MFSISGPTKAKTPSMTFAFTTGTSSISTAAITATETADGNLLLSTNHGTQVKLVGVDVDEWKDGWVRWNAEAPGWVW